MKNKKVALIDFGLGNLLSVQRALEYVGADVIITSKPKEILKATRVVLPGVGAFRNAMLALQKLSLEDTIKEIHFQKKPLLGICLGMQLLFDKSEEFGETEGLSIIPGKIVKIPNKSLSGSSLKIPHIGWSSLFKTDESVNWNESILKQTTMLDYFYFIHSFMAKPENKLHSIAYCSFGDNNISALVKYENTTGCQFHPEKSGTAGLKLLKRFCID